MLRIVVLSYPRSANCSRATARMVSRLGGEPVALPGRCRVCRLARSAGAGQNQGDGISTPDDIQERAEQTQRMMTSTTDEIPQDDGRRTRRSRHDAPIAVGLGVAGAFVALLLGLLTFGVQATVEPHHLPLAISTADAASATAMAPVLDRVAAQG